MQRPEDIQHEYKYTNTTDRLLNIAALCSSTYALGPGRRAVVWVQGCAFHCPGCIAPDWIPIRPARLVRPEDLIDELLADPDVTGLTFSGGEPMLQAAGLAQVARLARSKRDLNIICFTGFIRAQLEAVPPGPGVADLLDQVDVLIDGPYIARLNDNLGLRGSRNQKIHYLTDRLAGVDLEGQARKAEVVLTDGQAMMVGVPPHHLGEAFNQAVNLAASQRWELLRYERV
jgi:anaerobic ribonucleoside-triphosphate reductase activating protein